MEYRIVQRPEDRFWQKVEKSEGCWTWNARTNHDGYGQFWFSGRHVTAHRYAYEIAVAPIPSGMSVLHRCDNPACVKPAHLFLGTPLDNTRDMFAKGRHPFAVTIAACKRGHEFTPENTYIQRRSGTRQCKACKALRTRLHRQKEAAVA